MFKVFFYPLKDLGYFLFGNWFLVAGQSLLVFGYVPYKYLVIRGDLSLQFFELFEVFLEMVILLTDDLFNIFFQLHHLVSQAKDSLLSLVGGFVFLGIKKL